MARHRLVLALGFAACSREPAPPPADAAPAPSASAAPSQPWPDLPTTSDAARRLLAERTRRAPRSEPPLSRERLQASLAASAQKNELVAGWAAIAAHLATPAKGRSSFVLFGTFHDAPAQIAAFRKLVGPLGFGPSDAVVEQLHAPGRWRDVAPAEQAGDSAALDAGDRAALDALVASQRDHNYTAWKYDYLEELPALAATLGASGVRLHGCDLPTGLQARAKDVGDRELAGLRELHCVLALEERLRVPATVAMLWGARHVEADGAPRFLPADADVKSVLLFGGRPAGDGEEAKLGLRLGEPVLFPVEGQGRYALLLAEGALAARIDRVRTRVDAGEADRLGKLEVVSERELELWVGGQRLRVGPKAVRLALPPGHHGFLALPFAGGIPMPEHGFVELSLAPAAGSARLVVHRGR